MALEKLQELLKENTFLTTLSEKGGKHETGLLAH
jgi:hypothetical protein